MKFLKNIFLFKDLSEEETKQIISLLPPSVKFKKGDKIYSENNFSRCLGVIEKGRLCAQNSGVVQKEFSPGDIFGAAALFGQNEKYATDISALTDCSIVFISEASLKDIFSAYPVCAANYIEFLSEKIRFLNKKIELFAADSAERKLYLYLCENENTKFNASAVSRKIGIGRTSLYRCLAALEKNNMIIKENNKIKVILK